MADYNSELPIRSQYPSQVLPDDVIVKIGDATNPTTQMASVDTNGSLASRIADASGNIMASQDLNSTYWLQVVPPSNGSSAPGTASSYANLIAGIYNSTLPTLTSGQQAALQVNSMGVLMTSPAEDQFPSTQTITTQDIASTTASGYGSQVIVTGSPTDGSSATFALNTETTARVQVTGTWTGTLVAEGSIDGGTTWYQILLYITGTVFQSSSFTSNFEGNGLLSGLTNFRIRATSAITGTATIKVVESLNTSSTYVINPPKLVDGTTNNFATVLPASTATEASNTSLVTALSPNSPLPAGTNALGSILANLQVDNAAVTVTNPVPVTVTSASAGTPIQNYQTSSSLAIGANVNLTYTVPSTHSFSLERIWASSEARMKVTITINSNVSYVGFNSSANPNLDITITAPPTLSAGETVVVNFENIDKGGASDVYVTIEGNQIS